DRAASCESFFQAVPESNVVFAEPPAQKDLLSFTLRGEVDEPFVEVLDDRAAAVDVVDAASDSDPLALDFGLEVSQPLGVDTASVAGDLRRELLSFFLRPLLRTTMPDELLHERADLVQRVVRRRGREVARHGTPMIGPSCPPVNEPRSSRSRRR